MKKLPFLLVAFFYVLLIFNNISSAQNPIFPIVAMSVETTSISRDSSGGIPDLSDSTVFAAQMNVSLFDTTLIDKIYVTLSDSGAINTQLQHSFDWDIFGATGSGTSYTRTEYDVVLGLGEFIDLLHYSASIRIKRTDGTFTDYVTFSR